MSVKLPDGQSADLARVTHGLTVKVDNALRRAAAMLTEDNWTDYQAEILVLLIESWTLPVPVSVEAIEDINADAVADLYDAALEHYRIAAGRKVDRDTLAQTADPSPAASAKPSA